MSLPLAATVLELFGIIGVIVLIVLAAGVTFVAYHIWRFKRAIGQLGEQFKNLGNLGDVMKKGLVPSSLGLERLDDEELSSLPELLFAANHLEAAGLKRGGLYTMQKMPAARIVTLADPSRGVTVAAHLVPGYGLNVDVVTMFQDGSALTHRTLQSLGLEHPPKFESVVMTGATPTDVLQEHLASRDPSKTPRAIEPDDVAEMMEEYHAEETRWRDGRGGLTPGELRANRRAVGEPEPDPMQMALLLATSHAEAVNRQREANREPFLAASGWSAERWDAEGDRVMFVSDESEMEGVLATLGELNEDVDLSDAEAERLTDGGAIRATFAAWAATRPDLKIERVATWESPVATDAYFVGA